MQVNTKLLGAKETIHAIKSAVGDIEERVVLGVRNAAALVESQAKYLAPVDTGNLRNTIHMNQPKIMRGEVTASVSTNCEYAPFVEFGTGMKGNGSYPYKTDENLAYSPDWVGQPAQPYLGKALHDNKSKIQKIIKDSAKGSS